MNWKEYDYTAQWGPGDHITFRPILEVRVSKSTESIPTLALVDSGTDGTLFNAEIARSLKVDLNKCQRIKIGGIGEREGHICKITLFIPDFRVSMDIPVVFVEDPPFDGLLGQMHFFERFRVRFEKDQKKFYIKDSAKKRLPGRKAQRK